MKKILLTALSAVFLLSSCSQEDMPDNSTDLGNTISKLSDYYDAKLRGSIDSDKEKDEVTPSLQEETLASEQFITFLKDSIERTYSKTSVRQTKGSADFEGYVGVFKYSTCGSYREFRFHQDNEDGGWTNTRNSGASYADGNKNMEWSFCLVPGHVRPLSRPPYYNYRTQTPYHYGGGTLLLYEYTWNSGHGDIDVVYRQHDDEDHSNRNGIRDMGGHLFDSGNRLGECYFGKDMGLAWRFSDKARNFSLPFRYGVITNDFSGNSDGDINVDDENGSNANWARITRHKAASNTTERRDVLRWDERFRGIGIWNTNTQYMIKIYN